jgi:hypothetical protein
MNQIAVSTGRTAYGKGGLYAIIGATVSSWRYSMLSLPRKATSKSLVGIPNRMSELPAERLATCPKKVGCCGWPFPMPEAQNQIVRGGWG